MHCRVRPELQVRVLGLVGNIRAEQNVGLPPQRMTVGFGGFPFEVVGAWYAVAHELHVIDRRLADQVAKLAPRLAQHRCGARQL